MGILPIGFTIAKRIRVDLNIVNQFITNFLFKGDSAFSCLILKKTGNKIVAVPIFPDNNKLIIGHNANFIFTIYRYTIKRFGF